MAGITGLGTNYNLPNYTGVLYQLTPSDTPFLSAIGNLTGGGQTESTEFEWSTFDLRAAAQPAVVEGAAAPTAQERVRANVTNVCQIHQEKVSVAYSKIAAVGQKSGTNNMAPNNVPNEVDWQVAQMLKQMARDVEWSFINGTYQKPSDNTTARKTRGLLGAISTNSLGIAKIGTALPSPSVAASTDAVTSTAHGLSNGDTVIFTTVTGPTTISANTPYYVVNAATNTFKVATTKGGTAIDIDVDSSALVGYKAPKLTVSLVSDLLQSVYDNGGITESSTATIIVNSAQKRAISAAYLALGGGYQENSRTVGGVGVSTIVTDFGTLNIMLNRYVPQQKLIVASLEQCSPVFLEVPGKGHFFAEPLAKTGASDDVQLYGEVGLAYGNEKSHGVLDGLAI